MTVDVLNISYTVHSYWMAETLKGVSMKDHYYVYINFIPLNVPVLSKIVSLFGILYPSYSLFQGQESVFVKVHQDCYLWENWAREKMIKHVGKMGYTSQRSLYPEFNTL